MQFTTRVMENALVVTPNVKKIDATAVSAFKSFMLGLIKDGHDRLVLDLNAVEFMDSSGLAALLSCMKSLAQTDGKMALCRASETLRAMFRLTRFDRIFTISPSAEEAVRAVLD